MDGINLQKYSCCLLPKGIEFYTENVDYTMML